MEARTGCVRVVAACGLDGETLRLLRGTVEKLGLKLIEAEHCDIRSLLAEAGEPPEAVLVVAPSTPPDADRLRRVHGLFKLVSLDWCPREALPSTIEAVSCRPVPPRCLVDAGLGWLQA